MKPQQNLFISSFEIDCFSGLRLCLSVCLFFFYWFANRMKWWSCFKRKPKFIFWVKIAFRSKGSPTTCFLSPLAAAGKRGGVGGGGRRSLPQKEPPLTVPPQNIIFKGIFFKIYFKMNSIKKLLPKQHRGHNARFERRNLAFWSGGNLGRRDACNPSLSKPQIMTKYKLLNDIKVIQFELFFLFLKFKWI